MSILYKLLFYTKRRYAKWERARHGAFLREKIVGDGGVIGKGGSLGTGVNILGRGKAVIGTNVHIGSGAFIRADGGLYIGDNTIISRNLLLYTVNHRYEGALLPFDSAFEDRPVRIGPNVWIGMNVVICPGTEIGEGAIIGMGTTVYGTIPPLSVVGSGDWKLLRSRNSQHYFKLKELSAYAREDGYPLDLRAPPPQQPITETNGFSF